MAKKGALMAIFGFEISPEFWSQVQGPLVSATQIAIAVIGERFVSELRKNRILRHIPQILAVGIASWFTISKLSYYMYDNINVHGFILVRELLPTFVTFTIVWGVFFHTLAKDEGSFFTRKFGRGWVKAIDYAYLTLSFAGLMSGLIGAIDPESKQYLKPLIILTMLVIAIGLALRITKTTIEIWEWDKQPEDRAGNRRDVQDIVPPA